MVKANNGSNKGSVRIVSGSKSCKSYESGIFIGSSSERGAKGLRGKRGATGKTRPRGPQGERGSPGNPAPRERSATRERTAKTEPMAEPCETAPALRPTHYLAGGSQARFIVNVATVGTATSTFRVQYSVDQQTWTDLPGTTVNTGTTGLKVSTFTDIPAGAKQDVFLRIVGQNGDGVADPSYGITSLQFN